MTLVTQAAVDTGVMLDQAAEEPDHIRQPIQVCEHLRMGCSAALHKADSAALGATTDCTCDLIRCRLSMTAGERPVGEDALGCLDLVNKISEFVYVLYRNDGRLFSAFRRRCQRGADAKQCLLNLFSPCRDFFVLTNAAGKTELRI